jgi:NAD(P)H dehydrogenase (quinone)
VSESPGWKSVVAAAYDDFDASVRAAAEAGVRHVVYTSFASAAPDAAFTLGRDHFDAEQAIVETGVAHTFLRDSFYLDLLPFFSDATGVIRGPAGDGRVAGVARADVADVAATVLRAPADHAGATYGLTGPEALTFSEMAARASAVLGRDLRFETRPTTRRTPGGARSTAPRTGSSMPG